MRTPHNALFRLLTGLTVAVTLLAGTGCIYDQHRNMGATEKFEASGVHTIPKLVLFPFTAVTDSVISPATMLSDQIQFDDEQYDSRHHYYSYSGSRAIARSNMGAGWKMYATVPSVVIETVWLVVTGPVDLFTVLFAGDKGTSED